MDTETVNQQWITDNNEKNVLSGCYLREYRGDGLWDTNNPNEKDRLSSINDNDLSTYSNLNTSADPVMYSFNPKKTLSVKQVVISFAETSEIKDFDVYFADVEDKATLFADNNPNKISVTAQNGKRNYLITLDSSVSCNYIGVAVHKGNTEGRYNLHIAEIAAYTNRNPFVDEIPAGEYGKYPYTLSRDTITTDYVTEHMTENLIRYSHPTVTGDKYAKLKDGVPDDYIGLTNGKICESGSAYSAWFTEWQTVCYTFNIGYTVPIDRLMLISQYFPHGDYATREYEFYVGEDRDNLYDIENRVVYYNNEGRYVKWDEVHRYGTKQLFEFTGEDRPIGKYIGLRIIQPGFAETSNIGTDKFSGCGVRIDELGVYSNGNMPLDRLYSQTIVDTVSGVNALVRKLDFDDTFKLGGFSAKEIAVSSELSDYNSKHGLVATGKAYRVVFKDASGNEILQEDLGGRRIELRIPCNLTNSGNDTYVCQYIDGTYKNLSGYFGGSMLIVLMESPGDIYIVSDVFKQNYESKISFDWNPIEELSEGLIQIDDSPEEITVTDTVYVDIDSDSDNIATKSPAKTTYKKVIRRVLKKGTENSVPIWVIVSAIAGGVIIIGGIVTIAIIKKKRSKGVYKNA